MNVKMREKIICCICVVIMCLWGMGVGAVTEPSSFSRVENYEGTSVETLHSVEYLVKDTVVCTQSMLNKGMNNVSGNMSNSAIRWLDRAVLLFFVVGVFQQYLFYYQSAESKEDGRIFSCRTAIVDYIHLKDSGE